MSPLEEQALIEHCRGGDPVAWDKFISQYYPPMGRYICQLVPDATYEDVEEICQDAFLAAIRSLGSFRGQCQIQTWLFRIAGNKARDFRDRRLAAKRGGGRVPLSIDAEDPVTGQRPDPPSTSPMPDQRLVAEESMAEVRRGLDQLGDLCREILELRYFADLDYEAIGEVLGTNPKTVSSRLSRCLHRLGDLLAQTQAREKMGTKSV
ncbi:MAG: sigma-70 family RNA polymerase sigma factor [Verrucomicrobiales bacterium]|nr:sigma-70 family RNA polymerase sigma factor [Verrucomicrobiales bacterium]